jgi:hypothetical protein
LLRTHTSNINTRYISQRRLKYTARLCFAVYHAPTLTPARMHSAPSPATPRRCRTRPTARRRSEGR